MTASTISPSSIDCTIVRSGTAKAVFVVTTDLPTDPAARDDLVLDLLGSRDDEQLDGIGGGQGNTTRIALIGPPTREDADVDYLSLQPALGSTTIGAYPASTLYAAVGPFALERRLITPDGERSTVRIHITNPRSNARLVEARLATGDADLVTGAEHRVELFYEPLAGATCGSVLPSGSPTDTIDGVATTLVDFGVPVVIIDAEGVGASGYESCDEINADTVLKQRLESIRLKGAALMGLDEPKTVPKLVMIAPPRDGGALTVRVLVPHDAYPSIEALVAGSVSYAAVTPGTIVAALATITSNTVIALEHPTGVLESLLDIDGDGAVTRSGWVSTARTLMTGTAFLPERE